MCGHASYGGPAEPITRRQKVCLVLFVIALAAGTAWHYLL